MLVPMPPQSAVFLLAESREHPLHVGGLQLFVPPDGADSHDLAESFQALLPDGNVAAVFRKRARRSVTTLGQWGWEEDPHFDIEHHVRRNALPRPARVRELLTLVSRLHSSLLDRHRPLWEMHLVEGLADGRFAVYTKAHHALFDGVTALRTFSRMLSDDPDDRAVPPLWAPKAPAGGPRPRPESPHLLRAAVGTIGDVAGIAPALVRTVRRALNEQGGNVSLSAPQSMFNVPVTGARRFAAQSWPIERLRAVGRSFGVTVNDVVLAMCAGALREYLLARGALPDAPLVAMVPVSLHPEEGGSGDGGGNATGAVMCNLGTHLPHAADRLRVVHRSMADGKAAMRELTPLQAVAMTAVGIAPLGVYPLLHLDGRVRPPFNLVISNIPGPATPRFWNGARLDGLYPLSVVWDGQALNITVTSYAGHLAFGLTGCRRSVPHLQRLLTHLDEELSALERAAG